MARAAADGAVCADQRDARLEQQPALDRARVLRRVEEQGGATGGGPVDRLLQLLAVLLRGVPGPHAKVLNALLLHRAGPSPRHHHAHRSGLLYRRAPRGGTRRPLTSPPSRGHPPRASDLREGEFPAEPAPPARREPRPPVSPPTRG